MIPIPIPVALWLAPVACKVVDAPETVEELTVFGLLHFDEGGPWRTAFADGVQEQLANNREALVEGMRVDSLTPRMLVEHGISDDPGAGEVLGVVATVSFASDFDEVVRVVTGDMSRVVPTTSAYEVTAGGDRACFLARACEAYVAEVRRDVSGFWGDASQELRNEFRWAERSDGAEVLLYRGLAPEPTETDSAVFRIHQHYQLYAMVDRRGWPQKFEAHWVEAEIVGLDVPDTFALDQAVDSMRDQVGYIDAFVATGERN